MMCAGPRFEYHWQDGVTYKKPTKFSAPGEPPPFPQSACCKTETNSVAEYVDHLMNWVQDMLDDESLFPSKIGTSQQAGTQGPPRSSLALFARCRLPQELPGDNQIHRSSLVPSLRASVQPSFRSTVRAEHRG